MQRESYSTKVALNANFKTRGEDRSDMQLHKRLLYADDVV